MNRRLFTVKAGAWTAVAVGGVRLLVGCGNSGTTTGPTERIYTSSTVQSHAHQFTILLSTMADPPPGGLNGPTTSASGHTHDVVLTQDQLKAIDSGQTITVDTSVTNAHQHTFVFTKNGGTAGGGGGGGGGGGY